MERIRALAIPPAWEDVWICPVPTATCKPPGSMPPAASSTSTTRPGGRAGIARSSTRCCGFARTLPRLRARVEADLELRGLAKDRVLACAVRLLDLGFFRIGSDQYADENETFGLSTLRRRHLRFERGSASSSTRPRARSGRCRRSPTRPPSRCSRALRPPATRAAAGSSPTGEGPGWRDLTAEEINAYLKAITGGDFSAKDFRTWNATVLAAVGLANRVGAGRGAQQDCPQADRQRGGQGRGGLPRRIPRRSAAPHTSTHGSSTSSTRRRRSAAP